MGVIPRRRAYVLPDCTQDGIVNTLDFLCYLNLFTAEDRQADCNGDGAVDTLDFLCFLNTFVAGC